MTPVSKPNPPTAETWGRYAAGCFGSAAALLTATAATFVMGRVGVVFAVCAASLALLLFGLGFHCRRRADR